MGETEGEGEPIGLPGLREMANADMPPRVMRATRYGGKLRRLKRRLSPSRNRHRVNACSYPSHYCRGVTRCMARHTVEDGLAGQACQCQAIAEDVMCRELGSLSGKPHLLRNPV